jgi:hypothetical protein
MAVLVCSSSIKAPRALSYVVDMAESLRVTIVGIVTAVISPLALGVGLEAAAVLAALAVFRRRGLVLEGR